MAKIYELDDGTIATFDFDTFTDKIICKVDTLISENRKSSKKDICIEIAHAIHASEDTVFKWAKKKSAPADLEKVKDIAKYFRMDYIDLLEVVTYQDISNSENKIEAITDEEKNTEKEITNTESGLKMDRLLEKIDKLENTITQIHEAKAEKNINPQNTKEIVRSIYQDMCEYVFNIWNPNIVDIYSRESDRNIKANNYAENIKKRISIYMLDLPTDLFEGLLELQDLISKYPKRAYYDINQYGDEYEGLDEYGEVYFGVEMTPEYIKYIESQGVKVSSSAFHCVQEIPYEYAKQERQYFENMQKQFLEKAALVLADIIQK